MPSIHDPINVKNPCPEAQPTAGFDLPHRVDVCCRVAKWNGGRVEKWNSGEGGEIGVGLILF
jgi:hypothetical protein